MFAGMDCTQDHLFLLVVIDDFNVRRAGFAFGPSETNSPLIVDADAVFAAAIAFQRFKAIAGQSGQIGKRYSGFETIQLQSCRAIKAGEGFDSSSSVELGCLLVPKAANHRRG